jgi:hypothetical protein
MWPDDEGGNGTGTPTFSDPLKEFESYTEAAINPVLNPPVPPTTPDSNNSGSTD